MGDIYQITQFDLQEIRQALEKTPWEEDPMEPSRKRRGVFLGTVMSSSPSGKFYTPWANTLDENGFACCEDEDCDGSCCEAHVDGIWYSNLIQGLEALESGEGDPCRI